MATQSGQASHVCTCDMCQQHPYSAVAEHHRAINRVLATLDEKNRRRFVGLLASQWGRGGIQRLIEITGLSRNTIVRGRDGTPTSAARAERPAGFAERALVGNGLKKTAARLDGAGPVVGGCDRGRSHHRYEMDAEDDPRLESRVAAEGPARRTQHGAPPVESESSMPCAGIGSG